MKRTWTMVWAGLSLALLSAPANAFSISVNSYDHNRDGRWDRREYYDAYRDWCFHHHHRCAPRYEIYRGYDRYDLDHDGYLNPREVRAIHVW